MWRETWRELWRDPPPQRRAIDKARHDQRPAAFPAEHRSNGRGYHGRWVEWEDGGLRVWGVEVQEIVYNGTVAMGEGSHHGRWIEREDGSLSVWVVGVHGNSLQYSPMQDSAAATTVTGSSGKTEAVGSRCVSRCVLAGLFGLLVFREHCTMAVTESSGETKACGEI